MAWHYGTHSCGHDGRVQIYGPHKHREWKAKKWFERPCDECLAKQRQAENVQNAEKAREMELPNLKGVSEKQIAYGETCRMKLVSRIEKFIEKWENDADRFGRFYRFPWDEVPVIFDRILQISSAKWWIENERYAEVGVVLKKIYEDILIERRTKAQKVEETCQPEPLPPLRPENPKTETIAEIRIEGKKLQIRFPESRDDFRKVVQEKLRMSWKHGVWERKMDLFSGSIHDRAAEAAHHLLSEGFIVRLDDPQAREKAISGSYEPEHTRWVFRRTESGVEYFGIMWDRINEDYYSVAKRLPTAKWSNPYMLVRPEQFDEIMDFAQRYDFALSPGAEELVQKAREAKDRALLLNVQKPEDPKRVVVSTEPPKLEVPEDVGIDEELRDTD
jgi:hypothetical protein